MRKGVNSPLKRKKQGPEKDGGARSVWALLAGTELQYISGQALCQACEPPHHPVQIYGIEGRYATAFILRLLNRISWTKWKRSCCGWDNS